MKQDFFSSASSFLKEPLACLSFATVTIFAVYLTGGAGSEDVYKCKQQCLLKNLCRFTSGNIIPKIFDPHKVVKTSLVLKV